MQQQLIQYSDCIRHICFISLQMHAKTTCSVVMSTELLSCHVPSLGIYHLKGQSELVIDLRITAVDNMLKQVSHISQRVLNHRLHNLLDIQISHNSNHSLSQSVGYSVTHYLCRTLTRDCMTDINSCTRSHILQEFHTR